MHEWDLIKLYLFLYVNFNAYWINCFAFYCCQNVLDCVHTNQQRHIYTNTHEHQQLTFLSFDSFGKSIFNGQFTRLAVYRTRVEDRMSKCVSNWSHWVIDHNYTALNCNERWNAYLCLLKRWKLIWVIWKKIRHFRCEMFTFWWRFLSSYESKKKTKHLLNM